MVKIIKNLPTVRSVILSVLWLQIVGAMAIFWITHNSLIETRFGTRYVTTELETFPSKKQKQDFRNKVIPSLKKNDEYLPKLLLPNELPNELQFQKVFIDGLDNGILIAGPIGEGDAERFITFLAKNKETKFSFVALHSPGGTVTEALSLGREIRSRKLKTVLSSNAFCFSACPYVMAGGTERIFSSHSLLGVHQHYFTENLYIPVYFAVQTVQEGQASTFKHLKKMGVSTDVMEHILDTPPEEIYIFSTEELLKFNFATEIVENS